MTEQELLNLPTFPLQQYLAPCSDRLTCSDQTILCGRISSVVKQRYNVNAIICAQCMLNGTPDQAFIDNNIKITALGQLNLIVLGFYPDHATVMDMFRYAYQYSVGDTATIARIAGFLVDAVRFGRLSLEEADTLTDEIPELDA